MQRDKEYIILIRIRKNEGIYLLYSAAKVVELYFSASFIEDTSSAISVLSTL